MYCYCLFCKSDKCDSIVYVATKHPKEVECEAIYPKQTQHIRKQGNTVDKLKPVLPGYLFLYSEEELITFSYLFDFPVMGILRVLRNDRGRYELSGPDEEFAMNLKKHGGVLGKTPVYMSQGKLHLVGDSFAGLPAEILQVEKRNYRMKLRLELVGQKLETWVQYEMKEKAGGHPEDDSGENTETNPSGGDVPSEMNTEEQHKQPDDRD
ncbi:MAG: hypothetical protein IJ083_12305 [Clostridia bacterium]|nr:hypothetical protein [Clostridia bacterium]